MQIIDRKLLDAVSAEGARLPRKRKNFNFHPSDDARCHRLLNAVEPGTYIQPHRHLDPSKGEGIVVLRGRLGVVLFDEMGKVLKSLILEPGGDVVAVDLAPAEFHTLVSLEPGTVFFEAKAGPYLPLEPGEKASWAPEEKSLASTNYLTSIESIFRS